MRKLLFFAIAVLHVSFATADTDRLVVDFFGSPTCGECSELKYYILFPLQKANSEKMELRIHNIDTDSGFTRLLLMEELYGVKKSSSITLFFSDTFLSGYSDIQTYGGSLIESYLSRPEKWKDALSKADIQTDNTNKISEKFKSFSFLSILFAGLLDGVNPCAIATIIFLVSFLAARNKSRREILIVGICFTAAVFTTYLLLGIGAFRLITALDKYRWFSVAIRWVAFSFAAIVGMLSIIDAIKYKLSGKSEDIKLQLPKSVKLRIHKVISGNLSGRKLAVGAIVTGFLVTLLEAVCTGQIYLPTIILMTKQEGFRFIGWAYLVFYNVLFVLPLVIVMALAYYGTKWDKMAKAAKNNLILLKVLIGLVLFGLAFFIIL